MEIPSPSPADLVLPRYSPVTPRAIHVAVHNLGYSPDCIPRVTAALDEFQLSLLLADDGALVPHGMLHRASESRYLHVDHYPGVVSDGQEQFDEILLVSGDSARSYFEDNLGLRRSSAETLSEQERDDIEFFTVDDDTASPFEIESDTARNRLIDDHLIGGIHTIQELIDTRHIARVAFRIYADEAGFAVAIEESYPDDVTVLAVRFADYDELVMAEPGPVRPPLPGSTPLASTDPVTGTTRVRRGY